nr:hypothetical protein [Chlorogloeopsis fritschii]
MTIITKQKVILPARRCRSACCLVSVDLIVAGPTENYICVIAAIEDIITIAAI